MKILTGKVVSTKMDKTATVAVERVVIHPLYRKRFKRVKKYHVHDEMGAKVGQIVRFIASRPYSRLKKWKMVEVVKGESKKNAGPMKEKGKLQSTSARLAKKSANKKL